MKDPSIIALHGNLGSVEDWDDLGISSLRALDLWTFSDLSLDELSMFLAEDFVPPGEKPVLAGYSLGGRLALNTIAKFPDRFSAAVILSAHPGLKTEEERTARLVHDEEWALRARNLLWKDFLDEWNSQPVLADCPVQTSQEPLEPQRGALSQAFENWSLGRQDDLREALESYRNPVLWITGERDPLFTGIAEEMADVFEHFEHHVLPDCGHRTLGAAAADKINSWLKAT